MSKPHNDSFLPSGGFDASRQHSLTSPVTVPGMLPNHTHFPHSDSPSPNAFISHASPQHTPMSPPKTRSASAEESSAGLVEDWRAYAQKLRSQYQGERSHLLADRARVEEVMEEERQIWDKEREAYKARIAGLEALLAASISSSTQLLPTNLGSHHSASVTSTDPKSVSVAGSPENIALVPQESGRNEDGSPFYAPAPRNPCRTFDTSEGFDLRVDSITAPRENIIRVTSKELTSSDFGPQSPSVTTVYQELATIPEITTESIDISHIQPELEGVAIRVSAVSPTFAAKVLSPQRSPPKLSPDIKPPARDITNLVRDRSVSGEIRTLQVAAHPENRRLTMHAGHTPNHSISKFPFLRAESGHATPTKALHDMNERSTVDDDTKVHEHANQNMYQNLDDEHGDKELSGPLGLINEPSTDDVFIAQLTEKLAEEVRKSEGTSPASESCSSQEHALSPRRQRSTRRRRNAADEDEGEDEGPVLKLKPSFNFGRPLGHK